MRARFHTREQHIEMRRDDLFEWNEALTVGHHDEPRKQIRDLDARKAMLAGDWVVHHNSKVQRKI
ncbi:unannotated protein [freshwater metagenome]|uniref:Unannotated protein n=1 Tax=freshwater metagenome TaxID=449393 RepID=A0A6J6EQV2_9ZZZZ